MFVTCRQVNVVGLQKSINRRRRIKIKNWASEKFHENDKHRALFTITESMLPLCPIFLNNLRPFSLFIGLDSVDYSIVHNSNDQRTLIFL